MGSILVWLILGSWRIQAAAPPAGTSIGNQASATYTDASDTERTVTSNVALTIVQQVASFSLTESQSKLAPPGGQVFYPHTLVNTGNGSDTFNLSVANNSTGDNFDLTGVDLFGDVNGDGLPDNNTPITTTGPLAAGGIFKFVALGTVPGSETAGRNSGVTVTASGTATATPAPDQVNIDMTTVTGNAVINVTSSIDSSSGPPGSGPHTITITYNNTGNTTATNLTLMDVIPGGFAYVTNSARWSVTGSTPLTDASNIDPQGTVPDTIVYDFGETVAGRLTAVISRVLPGQSGRLTFQVMIPATQASGTINNTPTYSYDPGSGAPLGPYNSNTILFNVIQNAGVTLSGQVILRAFQGGVVAFTNLLQNTGNGSDSFDLTVTNVSFPAGTTFTLYQNDGNTPLGDSNGNGRPDTGPLGTNQMYPVVLKAVLPGGTAGGGPFTAQVVATSRANPTVSASANDILAGVIGNTVDLTLNGPVPGGAGLGTGPEPAPVIVSSNNPGITTRFVLYVNNTSAGADTFDLAASTDGSFIALALPIGWVVVFRNTSEAVITSSGVISGGGNQQLFVDVTVPADETPGTRELYFRALSPTSGALDRIRAGLAVNAVRQLSLTPNNNGQVFPAGTVLFSHILANNGNVLEGDGSLSSVTLGLVNSQAGWSSVAYYDANNNGLVDGGELAVTNLSFISGGGAGLAPAESVRLLVQVFAPPGVPLGTVNATTLTATTVNGTYTAPAPAIVTVTDNGTVVSGDIRLTKEQALDGDLDGVPDGPYSPLDISTGATPGKSIRYRITVHNNGTAAASSIRVFDATPTFTVYTAIAPAAASVGTVTAVPADGSSGSLEFDIGTLSPGQSAVITFGVVISP